MKENVLKESEEIKVVKVEAPTAKQIAVIWVSESGEAPDVQGKTMRIEFFYFFIGFLLSNKQKKMVAIKHGSPILDPACFPLLHPRGTQGWTYTLKKKRPINVFSLFII